MAILSTSSVNSKLQKLEGNTYQSDKNSKQLMFPLEMGNDLTNNTGHCVLFEPNIIRGHSVGNRSTTTTSGVQLQGAYGREVAMQIAGINGGSLRRDTGGGGLYSKSDERIALPMPSALAVNYSQNWQTTEIGGLARMGDFVNSVKDGEMGGAWEQLKDGTQRSLAGAAQSLGLGLSLIHI